MSLYRLITFFTGLLIHIPNSVCPELHERIVNKGKSKKVALIAVANKLIKQCFAIAKSGLLYDDAHRSVLVCN